MAKKPLIAIVTCHRFKGRADAQRNTWLKSLTQMDYKFFLGKGDREPEADEVFLDVPDDYKGLSWKTRAIMKWALDNGYDTVFKCDDDAYVFPQRLYNVLPKTLYEGRVNTSNRQIAPKGWCSGFAYWLSGEALSIIANAPEPTHKAEDLWVGITLSRHNIYPTSQPGFIVLSIISSALWYNYQPLVIAACEFREQQMVEFHNVITNPIPPPPITQTINYRTGKKVVRFGEVLRRRR